MNWQTGTSIATAVTAIAAVALNVTQQSATPAQQYPPLPDRIDGIPAPEDMLTVREGEPFTVPPGKKWVLTGLTRDSVQMVYPETTFAAVLFDGARVIGGHLQCLTSENANISPPAEADGNVIRVPPGICAGPGTVVTVIELSYANSSARGGPASPSPITTLALGYLYEPSTPALKVKGIPSPSQMAYVREGAGMTVPSGKTFVITGVGVNSLVQQAGTSIPAQHRVLVTVDGSALLDASLGIGGGAPTRGNGLLSSAAIQAYPAGLVIPGGSTIGVNELASGGPWSSSRVDGILLGYFADQ